MPIYLIKHGKDNHVVLAENQIIAISGWIEKEQRKNIGFEPGDFCIEEIKTKFGLIQAK